MHFRNESEKTIQKKEYLHFIKTYKFLLIFKLKNKINSNFGNCAKKDPKRKHECFREFLTNFTCSKRIHFT